MCAIVGLVTEEPISENGISFLKTLFREAKIRGLHATGLSWVADGKIRTEKRPVPADQFILELDQFGLSGTKFIGHCRYSTSDLEFNQPIACEEYSIVHNGVVTQEDPSNWKEHFGGDFLTKNDTEVIYNCLKRGENPLEKLPKASMAVLSLSSMGQILAFRNGKRPMWFGFKPGIGMVVSSTKDILLRAGITNPIPSIAGDLYEISPVGVEVLSHTDVEELQR